MLFLYPFYFTLHKVIHCCARTTIRPIKDSYKESEFHERWEHSFVYLVYCILLLRLEKMYFPVDKKTGIHLEKRQTSVEALKISPLGPHFH